MKKTITLFFVCFLAAFSAWGQVCQINETGVKYTTLTDALSAVTSNQTITLLADITHTNPIDLGNKSVTFNMGAASSSHVLTIDVSATPGSTALTTAGDLTVTGVGNFYVTGAAVGINLTGTGTQYFYVNLGNVTIKTTDTGAGTAAILSSALNTYITGWANCRISASGTSGDAVRLTNSNATLYLQGTTSLGMIWQAWGSGTGHGLNFVSNGNHSVTTNFGSSSVGGRFWGGENGNGVNYAGVTGSLTINNAGYGAMDYLGGQTSGNGVYTKANLTLIGYANIYSDLTLGGYGTGSGVKLDYVDKTININGGGNIILTAYGNTTPTAPGQSKGLWLKGSTTFNTGSLSPRGIYIDTDNAILTINSAAQLNSTAQSASYGYGIYAVGALTLVQSGSSHVNVSAKGAGDKEGIFIGGGKDLTLSGDISVTTNGGDNAKGIALSGTGKINFAGDNQKLTVGNTGAGDLTLPCHKTSALFWTSIYDVTISSGADADADVIFTLPAAGKYKTGSIYLSNGIPSIIAATLPSGVVGVAYPATTVVATNNTESWTVSGALPDGLTINKGVISGTPTAAGTFTFSLIAGNTTHGSSAPVSFSITIQNFVPVTNITGVPIAIKKGETGYLYNCTVLPYDATYYNIAWSLQSTGTTGAQLINNNAITTVSPGTLILRATIKDGAAPGTDYIQDFTIPVTNNFCEIVGGNQYSSMQLLMGDVPDNTHTFVQLLDYVVVDEMIPGGANNKNITFILNGYNLTWVAGESGGLYMSNGRIDCMGKGIFKATTGLYGNTALGLGDNSFCSITSVEVNEPGKIGISSSGKNVFTGNVIINAEGATGVQAYSDDLTINGNIIVTTGTAISAGGGAKVTVNGTVDPSLITFNGKPCDPVSNKSAVSSKPGFTEYTDGDSYVWVSMHGTIITWQGGTSADWNDPSNWDVGRVPTSTDVVYIPGPDKVTNFPVLISPPIGPPIVMNSSAASPGVPPIDGGTPTTPASAEVSEIHFAPGAELGRQDLLKYNKAFVQLDFSSTGLARNRWWMLTNPLQQLYSGDFSFGGLPGMSIKSLVTVAGVGAWNSLPLYNKEFGAGDSFELWLTSADFDNPGQLKGLNASKGIITLPYFENADENIVHWTQTYIPGTGSTFDGGINSGGGVFVPKGTPVGPVLRDMDKAYKLTPLTNGVFVKTLDFGKGTGNSLFAATGNPFMSSISFNALQAYNNSLINATYWVWVGPGNGGYAIYNMASGTTTGITSYGELNDAIPPMQSFIVERNSLSNETQISFNIAAVNATGKNKGAVVLRDAVESNDILEITASAQQSAVRAVIASREQGSLTFNRLDSRKLSAEISDLPDIYTLKQSADKNMVAIAANVINEINEDIVIPLGISTTYEGSITFSFTGPDTYNARIFLIDNANPDNKEIELTGKAKYEYTFSYVPEKVNGTAVSNEKRFAVRLSPTSITGIETVTPSNILVFSRSAGTIQAVSGEVINQITVIDLQGRKIYENASVNTREYTVTGLSTGVYIVKAVTGNEVITTKVIVK